MCGRLGRQARHFIWLRNVLPEHIGEQEAEGKRVGDAETAIAAFRLLQCSAVASGDSLFHGPGFAGADTTEK